MRWRLWAPVALLLVVPAFLPIAEANHPQGGFIHVNPRTGTLAPGARDAIPLDFERGPFERGWVFVMNARVASNGTPARVELVYENRTVDAWDVPPGGTRLLSTLMPETGFYTLNWSNPGNETVRYAFFYDQSCDCAGKPIPFEILDGMVIFNQDLERGQRVRALFAEPPAMAVKIWLAKRTGGGGTWPTDFTVLQESLQAEAVREPGAPTEGRLHEFNFTADETTRYYYFVQSKEVYRERVRSPNDVFVVPQFQVSSGAGTTGAKSAPLGIAIVLAALATSAVLSRRRPG